MIFGQEAVQAKLSTLTAIDDASVAAINKSVPGDLDDAVLKNLKRQHLENLANVRNERDLLEEQEQLEDLKERIQRRKEEKKRELDHEDWIAKQKRELISLRLQRALSEDEKANELPSELLGKSTDPYNPDSGFVILWDYVAGVPAAVNDLQITYAVFDGKSIQTPFKVVLSKGTNFATTKHTPSLEPSNIWSQEMDWRCFLAKTSQYKNGKQKDYSNQLPSIATGLMTRYGAFHPHKHRKPKTITQCLQQISLSGTEAWDTLKSKPSNYLNLTSALRHPKTGAITLQQYGWTFLPVLANSRSVGTCCIQLPLFQGEVNLDVLKVATGGLSALVDDVGNDKVKQLLPVAEDGASLFVRLHDPQLPHISTQPVVNATLSKMIPSRLSAKYTYDSVKIAALKKKSPLTKLLPTNVPEAQFEKDLNQAFAHRRASRSSNDCESPMDRSNQKQKRKQLKKQKSKTHFHFPQLRFRKKTPLQLEDFDDVRYQMELVRLGDEGAEVEHQVALLESIFLALVCMLAIGGCVAVGFATHLMEYSKEALSWLLPMLLLPLVWVASLHLWERQVIALQSKIATI
ncbi:hypothetical protein BBJ29_004016 [Phytophthora kernoviae]|uniref:Uncharacterized protein n=1 Tax=Phytophthora kernoviae TaxID=325452 RepID=A0A3F2RLY2_9STRA|nr:hypothetical protein BBP00_00006388 [Phytophthora kernoviae]RLN71476.1 hypothetical protein BBJ29_004016 [Phytophthora kernoviae]